MRPFRYARPTTVDDLLGLLSTHGPAASLLAGGTDLLVRLRLGHVTPDLVIDIKHVDDLRADIVQIGGAQTGPIQTSDVHDGNRQASAAQAVSTQTGDVLRIGARALMSDITDDARVRRHFPALADSARVVGSVQIRNRATLAGNICNASPAADTAPALLVYGAIVNIVGGAGQRRVPVCDFFVGPGRTVLTRLEIVASIDLPLPTAATGAAFGRITRRYGVDLASVNLCCLVTGSGETRFAYGAVGPRPFLVRDESGALADPRTPAAVQDDVLRRLMQQASPISDVRADQDYRVAMLAVTSRRALASALERRTRSARGQADEARADAGEDEKGAPRA